MKHVLIIEGKLPSLNEHIYANRSNRYVGAKLKKDTQRYISAFILQQLKGISFDNPVEINFKWYEPNRKRDLDNICASKKQILDALVSMKVIQTDSWRGVVGFTDKFYIDKDNPRIEVEIGEANARTQKQS